MTPHKLNICLLANAASIHVERWAKYLVAKGHTVHVVSLSQARIDGVEVHHVPWWPPVKELGYLLAAPRMWRIVRRISPDVLHSHYAMSYGILGALSGFKPLVVSAWGSDVLITPRGSPLRKFALGYAFQRAELVTSLAVHISEALQQLGVPQSKIVTLPFGVDTQVFCQPSAATPRGIDLICTRNFDHVYNLDLLLQALSMVIPRRPGVTCALAGDGPLKPHLQRLVSRLGIEKNVQWLGWLPTMDLANYLKQSKVFVNPSSSDGTSTALTEAMACGCFPIATDIAANRPWVREGVAGYLVPSDRPEILADRILHALDSVQLRNQAASLNEETVKSRANWYTNMAQIESHYYRLAKRPSSRAGVW